MNWKEDEEGLMMALMLTAITTATPAG